jgi:hypothetical protein
MQKVFLNTDLNKFKIIHSADYSVKATYSDNFILYRGDDFIEIIVDEKYLNKKLKILLDNEIVFNDILQDTSLFIYVNEIIDLDELVKHLSIITD